MLVVPLEAGGWRYDLAASHVLCCEALEPPLSVPTLFYKDLAEPLPLQDNAVDQPVKESTLSDGAAAHEKQPDRAKQDQRPLAIVQPADVEKALASSFLLSYQKCMSNKRKKTTSAFVKESAVQDALCTLGHTKEVEAMLRRFCVNPEALPRGRVLPNGVAESFCSHRTAEHLKEAASRCLSLLRVQGHADSRPFLVMDETVWSRNYVQVTGLRGGGPVIVGGCWNEQAELDFSCIPATEEVSIQTLPKEHLAALTQHFVIKRPDNGRYILDLLCVPGAHTGSSRELLRLSGQVLEAVVQANQLVPALGLAFDCGTKNSDASKALCGLLKPEELQGLPFWETCVLRKHDQIGFWPFGELVWSQPSTGKEFRMYGSNGGWHVQKRYSLAHCSGCRMVVHGDLWMSLSPMARCDLGSKAFSCSDVQSDMQASCRLSPSFAPRSFDGLGLHVHQLLGGLLASVTTASRGFSKHELAANSFSLYFMTMLHVCRNYGRFRDDARQHTLSLTTARNIAYLAGHCVAMCQSQHEHRQLQELAVEQHFSRIKGCYRGTPAIKDCVTGIAVDAMKQLRELNKLPSDHNFDDQAPDQDRAGLPMSELVGIAKQALAASCQLYAWISIDCTVDDIYRTKMLLAPDDPSELGDEEDALEVLAEEGLAEIRDLAVLQGVDASVLEQPLDLLHLVQDRAAQAEQLEVLLDEAEGGEPLQQVSELEDVEVEPGLYAHLVPEEPAAVRQQPKTLTHILQQTAAKKVPELDLGEDEAAGALACVKRAAAMLGPVRQFCRFVRLEEGKLSCAMLEKDTVGLSTWNKVEHELALARRVASLQQTRLSRAETWASIQRNFVGQIVKSSGSGEAAALKPVSEFRPPVDGEKEEWQIVFVRGQSVKQTDKVVVAAVMTIFRGSVCQKGKAKGRVRTGRPMCSSMPFACTRMVHAVMMRKVAERTWDATGADVPLVFDPTDVVLGEPAVETQYASKHRLRVCLTAQADEALAKLSSDSCKLPRMPAAVPAEESEPAAPKDSTITFNDRSFPKAALRKNMDQFMRSLATSYKEAGAPFLDENGKVQLAGGALEDYAELSKRAPTMLEKEFAGARGWTFSQKVHSFLKQMMPSENTSASGNVSTKRVKKDFLRMVVSATTPSFAVKHLSTDWKQGDTGNTPDDAVPATDDTQPAAGEEEVEPADQEDDNCGHGSQRVQNKACKYEWKQANRQHPQARPAPQGQQGDMSPPLTMTYEAEEQSAAAGNNQQLPVEPPARERSLERVERHLTEIRRLAEQYHTTDAAANIMYNANQALVHLLVDTPTAEALESSDLPLGGTGGEQRPPTNAPASSHSRGSADVATLCRQQAYTAAAALIIIARQQLADEGRCVTYGMLEPHIAALMSWMQTLPMDDISMNIQLPPILTPLRGILEHVLDGTAGAADWATLVAAVPHGDSPFCSYVTSANPSTNGRGNVSFNYKKLQRGWCDKSPPASRRTSKAFPLGGMRGGRVTATMAWGTTRTMASLWTHRVLVNVTRDDSGELDDNMSNDSHRRRRLLAIHAKEHF
ncbi:unnamed protein product [Symbiodinium sp. CCMP2592]|nr:unnamed protein product [Symbiodinium sp. CCMP2592]